MQNHMLFIVKLKYRNLVKIRLMDYWLESLLLIRFQSSFRRFSMNFFFEMKISTATIVCVAEFRFMDPTGTSYSHHWGNVPTSHGHSNIKIQSCVIILETPPTCFFTLYIGQHMVYEHNIMHFNQVIQNVGPNVILNSLTSP